MECKKNKWYYKEGGGGGHLQKGKVRVAYLDGDEIEGSGVNVIFTGVHEMERTREGVAVLLNDMWHSEVVTSGYVSSRILLIKFKFSRGLERHGQDSG